MTGASNSPIEIDFAENGTGLVTTVAATDPEDDDDDIDLMWSIRSGTGFAIGENNGELSFVTPPNFEARATAVSLGDSAGDRQRRRTRQNSNTQ